MLLGSVLLIENTELAGVQILLMLSNIALDCLLFVFADNCCSNCYYDWLLLLGIVV